MTDPMTRLNAALEGRYRIERQLGEGGMATVFLAEDLKHKRRVALKVLKPELAAVVGAERFLAEIETTANLQHPHILPLFDSGQAGGFLFYVMPWVEGESLLERIEREHQLPVDEAVRIATSVAQALDYAHRRGVIHRDIKPANILLHDGQPVVSDFGIALAVSAGGGGRLTETGLSLGTPHYMSPEQATGDTNVGPATDVYALGCVLYEMLVGEPPYTGSTPQAILGKIIQAESVSATKARRTVPANVDAVIRKALEKVPADRFTGAHDFARALGEPGFRHGEAAGVLSQQRRPRWLTPALVAVSILVGAVGATFLANTRRAAPPLPSTRVRITPPDAVRSGFKVSPDGRYIVGVSSNPAQLWLWRLSSLEATPLAGTNGALEVWWSPDSRSVAFETFDALRRIDIAGGPPQTLTDIVLGGAASGYSGAWSRDGVILFAQGNGLSRVAATGGEATPVVTRSSGHLDLPVFLPNGIDFLYLDHYGPEGTSGVYVGSLDRAPEEQPQAPIVAAQDGPLLVLGDRQEAYLLFSRGGTLMSQSFDVDALAMMGDAVPLASGVAGGEGNGMFSASSRGEVLIYVEGVEGTRGTLFDLVLVDRQGAARSLNLGMDAYWYPRFSPDGGRLAVAIESPPDEDLWVFDLDRGSRSRVTFGGNNRFFPVWTPDGDGLTHGVRNIPSTGSNTIRTAPAQGGGATETLLERDGEQNPTSWSPDGNVLAYHEVSPETGRDVWLLPRNGGPEPLLVTRFNEQGAIFSPDGRWLAYTSDESGQEEVYVRPFQGPAPRHTISTHGGAEPVWSRDGSELFYRTGDQLMVVDVELGESFRAEAPRPLFVDRYAKSFGLGQRSTRVAQYDVAPDGQHFVMLRAATETASVILLQNLLEELRERVPD